MLWKNTRNNICAERRAPSTAASPDYSRSLLQVFQVKLVVPRERGDYDEQSEEVEKRVKRLRNVQNQNTPVLNVIQK